ncbi:hypothetical protein KAR91_62090 [Candidatus Pacearchaeota archaeon]|nr:hypothetical protein [Candidatus Pacearchaeota archaeon]
MSGDAWAVAIYPLFLWFGSLAGALLVVSNEAIKEGGSKKIVVTVNVLVIAIIVLILSKAIVQAIPFGIVIFSLSVVLVVGGFGIFVYGIERES